MASGLRRSGKDIENMEEDVIEAVEWPAPSMDRGKTPSDSRGAEG